MARVTVEDCIDKVDSRFELVLLAAKRARQLTRGAAQTVQEEGDKPPVTALREISGNSIDLEELREEMIKHHQKHVIFDDDEEDEEVIELMAGEQGWSGDTASAEDVFSDTMQTEEADLSAEEDDSVSSDAGLTDEQPNVSEA